MEQWITVENHTIEQIEEMLEMSILDELNMSEEDKTNYLLELQITEVYDDCDRVLEYLKVEHFSIIHKEKRYNKENSFSVKCNVVITFNQIEEIASSCDYKIIQALYREVSQI